MSKGNEERTRELLELTRTLPIVYRLTLIQLIAGTIETDVRSFAGGLFDISGVPFPTAPMGTLFDPPPAEPLPPSPVSRHELSALGASPSGG